MPNAKAVVGALVVIVVAALAAKFSRLALWTALAVLLSVYFLVVWRDWFGPRYWDLGSTVLVAVGAGTLIGALWWWFVVLPPVMPPTAESTSATARPVDSTADPVIDLAIGQPFSSSTLITLKNAGIVTVDSVAVNLRCFWLRAPNDDQPLLLFDGFPSLDSANSWWTIPTLEPNTESTKDAADAVARYLQNKRASQSLGPFLSSAIVAVDVSYQRRIDGRRFSFSGVADLFEDANTGQPFMRPKAMSDSIEQLLKRMVAPPYRLTP